jgi:hypothetical protein
MKIAILAALIGSAAAFAPAATLPSRTSRLAATTKEAAAKSAEEDIELTLKVIMSSMTDDDGAGVDDSDVDDESAAEPAAAATEVAPAAAVAASSSSLWSVGYDDTVKMAYAAAGSTGDFGAFKSRYLEEWSAVVAQKGLL